MQQVMEETRKLLDDLDRGLSLPSSWYTDPAITDLERERIFRRSWQYIGNRQQLSAVGDYITGYVSEIPVVVVRNANGIEGFVNVCRHRRHEVMSGCGNAKIMQCPYHAWTYDLGGCLKAAPRSDREKNFHVEDYPLLPIRVELLGPFVFVNADQNARPLDSSFAGLLETVAGSGLDLPSLQLWSREEWASDSNWKTMLENYLECYHCPVRHPEFSAVIDVDQDSYKLTAHEWYSSQIGYVRQSALEGKSKVETYDARGAIVQAQYHLLWPNFTININPGYPNLSVDVWVPDGPNKTRGFSEQYFGPAVSKEWAADVMAFNKTVGEQDDELTDSVQRGLLSGIPERGRFLTESEQLVIHFQKLVVKALAGQ
ncbi:MAG TPA: aromatic ring-hydroxylating dioxygenase subunit alpha [Candidatus Obscuribacterales bacterium]